jgi:RND superfamily putative drug exporter
MTEDSTPRRRARAASASAAADGTRPSQARRRPAADDGPADPRSRRTRTDTAQDTPAAAPRTPARRSAPARPADPQPLADALVPALVPALTAALAPRVADEVAARLQDTAPARRDADSPDAAKPARADGTAPDPLNGRRFGPLGRLGAWTATHFRPVLVAWLLVVVALGAFAPKVEHALAGAGWEAKGSDSVQAREIVQEQFGGMSSSALQVVVASEDGPVTEGAGKKAIDEAIALLKEDERVADVVPPQPGMSISQDGKVAVVQAGAGDPNTNEMVRAADDLKDPLRELGGEGVTVAMTGSSVLWSDFNAANRDAMIKSELISWPVTLGILVLAFGSLVAAGLPLMLTIIGLVAAAGSLYIGTLFGDISIWAMNFALMFALALGIDYALFLVVRFRAAHFGQSENVVEAVAETMETAGKAVLFSGLTVLISLSAVMLVPSPAVQSMALGIMLAVVFVLAATLTLLPAVLARLGDRVDAVSLPWVHAGEHRSPKFAAWAERLWRRPLAYGAVALIVLIALALPVFGLRTGMPSIKVVPEDESSRIGYALVTEAFGPGAPGMLQVVAPEADAQRTAQVLDADTGIAQVMPAMNGEGGMVLVQAVPTTDPSSQEMGDTIDRLRAELPGDVLVGGAAVENYDLENLLGDKAPLVIGVVLALGFLLLLVALQAPLISALGVLTNLLATAAAFGVARLIFDEGIGSDLLGFESQGFLDAWAPVFFFAMIFAIGMDYTVFLLASAKEHWEKSGDAKEAMVGGLAHSGRTIFAAAGVMVAVFFTFALSEPLPPKEMGIILGVAVLLDALLIRLLLLPVLLRLTGKAAWASPAWLRKVLPNVTFSH